MKQYLFIILLSLITLVAAYPSIDDITFINREYVLDSKYLPQLIAFSRQYDIRIETLQNWIMAESSGREKAYNRRSKDYGLCQLHNVKYLVRKYWTLTGPFNVWNGEHNLFVGLAYLGDLISELGTYYGFMAYNIGSQRIKDGRILDCGRKYVSRILPGEKGAPVRQLTVTSTYNKSLLTFKEQILFDDRRKYV